VLERSSSLGEPPAREKKGGKGRGRREGGERDVRMGGGLYQTCSEKFRKGKKKGGEGISVELFEVILLFPRGIRQKGGEGGGRGEGGDGGKKHIMG